MFTNSFNTLDYIFLFLILSINFIIAYKFRKHNESSEKFLYQRPTYSNFIDLLDDLGIIEIILISMGAAYFGFNIIYCLFLGLLSSNLLEFLLIKKIKKIKINNFSEYILQRFDKKISVSVSLFCIIFLLCLMGLGLTLLFKSFQSVLNSGFINYAMGVLGFYAIIIVIGGRIADYYNRIFNCLIILSLILFSLYISIPNLNTFLHIGIKLKLLGLESFNDSNYFFLPFKTQQILYLILVLISFISLKILLFTSNKNNFISKFPIKILIFIIIAIPGIIAIAPGDISTPKKINIETIPTQFSNGDTGYIIKSVNKSLPNTNNRGLVPHIINSQTGLIEFGKYNFESVAVIYFKHYFPKKLKSFLLIILILSFMISINKYLFRLLEFTLYNVLIPLNMIEKYGKIGELWSLQTFLFSFIGITFILTYFLCLNYNLVNFLLYGTIIFGIPIFLITLLSLLFPLKNKYAKKE